MNDHIETDAADVLPGGKPKNMAKVVLHTMNRVLPSTVYQALYDPAFDAYQRMVQANYRRKIERHRRAEELTEVQRGELVHLVMPYSLVGTGGLERTYDVSTHAVRAGLDGAFVECGVARGGCAGLIATVAAREGRHRPCWFFDSYEGLPDPTEEDFQEGSATGDHIRPLPRGSCLGTYEEVERLLFEHLRLNRADVSMVKGWFQDTLPIHREQIGPIAMLRLDGDWYDSTICCLDNLFDQVVPGAYVIIDDYYSCYGAKRATDEFLEKKGLRVDYAPDGRGGCSFQVPGAD